MYPEYFCEGKISEEQLSDIKVKVEGMIFQKIGGVVLSSVDTIVISAFLGLATLGFYQNYYYILTSLFGVLSVIMRALISSVGNSVAQESVEKNYKDFKKFNFLYIWIVSWCTCCLLNLYQPFMQLWVGPERMLGLSIVMLFSAYFFVHKWCDMLYVYQEACGIWWETKWVPLCAAVVNLTINIILVTTIGLPGILISTIVSVLFVYDIGYARVLFSVYFKGRFKEYVLRQVFYLVCAAIACGCTFVLCELIPGSPVVQLFIRGIICIVIGNGVLLLLWHGLPEFKEAKKLLWNIAGSRLTKKKQV